MPSKMEIGSCVAFALLGECANATQTYVWKNVTSWSSGGISDFARNPRNSLVSSISIR